MEKQHIGIRPANLLMLFEGEKMGMKPTEYKNFLKAHLTLNPHRVVFVTGAVGVGKSQCTKQVADELNWEFRDIRLSLLDATDLRGLPTIDKEKKETLWTRPTFLPPQDYDKDVLLFFDEFSNANASLQNACLQLVLDRQLGEYKLPPKARVICAGNRLQDGAYVFRLSSALSNRFINIEFEPDFEDWKHWAYENNINPLIIAFHNYTKGDLLNNFKNDVDTKAFATPRSWVFVHEILKLGISNGMLYECLKGAVGEGAGTEIYGFLKIYKDLPNPLEILKDGKNIIPAQPDVMYALVSAIINEVRQNTSFVDRMIDYSMKLQKEFSILLMKDALSLNEIKNKIILSPKWKEFYSLNSEFVLEK